MAFSLPVLLTLAQGQHGAVSVPQLVSLGATESTIRNLVRSGRWIRVTPLVLRLAGTPRTRAQELVEAALDAGLGAAVSHLPAASWWGANLKPGHLQVSRLRGTTTTTPRLARVHEPRCFPDHHRTVLRGVPITVPARVAFDIAATLPSQAEKVLDRLWARHLLTHLVLIAMLDELAERGRTGITLMRELLAARGPDYRPNDTNLEDRFQQLAREAGLALVRQRHMFGREWLGQVDFVDLARGLVIEVNSDLYHDALVDRAADADRRSALEAAGFQVEEVWESEIWFDPAGTVARLRRLARDRRRHVPLALPA
jgi:very-short-patch-repair endonuclease